jgi:flavin reductase (DIM6/NTAB) family NADH-FMN oxidoreductase RutF
MRERGAAATGSSNLGKSEAEHRKDIFSRSPAMPDTTSRQEIEEVTVSAAMGNRESGRRGSDDAPSVGRDLFVRAMGRAVSGVTVVATDGPAGRFAVTVSAMSSVSADPPLILACIRRHSPANRAIAENGVFCVSVLAAAQAHVSDTFAGRPRQGEPFDFAVGDWRAAATGAPALADAAAIFDCALWSAHEAGSHTVFIGRVLAAGASEAAPLLYTGRRYGRPMPLDT